MNRSLDAKKPLSVFLTLENQGKVETNWQQYMAWVDLFDSKGTLSTC